MDNVAKDMLMGMMGPSWDGGNHRWDGKLGMKRAFPFYLVSITAYNRESDVPSNVLSLSTTFKSLAHHLVHIYGCVLSYTLSIQR